MWSTLWVSLAVQMLFVDSPTLANGVIVGSRELSGVHSLGFLGLLEHFYQVLPVLNDLLYALFCYGYSWEMIIVGK
jgi:hypothetical protein